MSATKPFELGKTYSTLAGNLVMIREIRTDIKHAYDCVIGDDGICRYNRDHDRGRTTASGFTCPTNLIPEPVTP